jgi:hypothetical protein
VGGDEIGEREHYVCAARGFVNFDPSAACVFCAGQALLFFGIDGLPVSNIRAMIFRPAGAGG